jgi:AcrR family transcriptional regulator
MPAQARERLVRAAFDLFAQNGFEQTTVDQIAAHAGTGRTTFFRHFPTKESVVFPDHDAILTAVAARLRSGGPATVSIALFEAARIVLDHYLDEHDVARERYRLTRTVPSLRNAEIAGQHRYMRLFREHLRIWSEESGQADDLRIEVLANALVTAHNHVLRAWLRGEATDPRADLEAALVDLTARLWPTAADPGESQVVVLRTERDLARLLPDLERVLRG